MTLSLMGMEEYLQTQGTSLFDGIDLPQNFVDEMDPSYLFMNIILESADFEVLYPEPETLHIAIITWFGKWYHTIEKWTNALYLDYDPLNNYQKDVEWKDKGTDSQSSITNNNSENDNTNGGNDTDSVWAYNSSSAQNWNKTDRTGSSHNFNTSSSAGNVSGENSGEGERHETGFRGKSKQDLIKKELEIGKFNLIQRITDAFIADMCLCIY